MRLNRYLAAAGLGSRRGVEEMIKAGRIRINGRVVTDLATQVGTGDTVNAGARTVRPQELIHAALYKPKGFVCSADDERERRTIFDLLPRKWPRTFHVGRLDMESEGLLLITNDGELSLALTHPRYHVAKEYEVGLDKPFLPEDREKLLGGFRIEGGWARIEHLAQLAPKAVRVILAQGIKRQIRLMFHRLGYEVTALCRVRIGPLRLGALKPGEWRLLHPTEVRALKSAARAATDSSAVVR